MGLAVISFRTLSSASSLNLSGRARTSGGLRRSAIPPNRGMSTAATNQLQYPPPIVVPAKTKHTATVFVFHGLGDTGEGWSFLPQMVHNDLKHVKFVFPTAPQRSITLNRGMRMTGWYDIASLEKLQVQDKTGMLESKRYVEQLVQQEVDSGIPSDRIVTAGFSQGGAISLLMLRSNVKLAGIVGLSTYLPLSKEPPLISEANKSTPVLMCHGDSDPVISYEYGRESFTLLKSQGANITFVPYWGMGHSACPEELEELKKFLVTTLPPL